jgi:uncharacterized protein
LSTEPNNEEYEDAGDPFANQPEVVEPKPVQTTNVLGSDNGFNLDPETTTSNRFSETPRPKTYILHHDDPDGWLAAGIAIATLGTAERDFVAKAVQYGKPFPIPLDELKSDDYMYIMDFSYDVPLMNDIKSRIERLVVMDHHESARESLAGLDYAIFDITKSGARLAWDYFVGEDMPSANVDIIDAYDLWKKDHPVYPWKDIAAFHLAAVEKVGEMGFWVNLANATFLDRGILANGRELYKDIEGIVDNLKASPLSEKIAHKGIDIFFTHNKAMVSLTSDALYSDKELNTPVTIMAFERDDNKIVMSIRSAPHSPVTALEIAKVFGGGGHVPSAGCSFTFEGEQADVVDYVRQKLAESLVS